MVTLGSASSWNAPTSAADLLPALTQQRSLRPVITWYSGEERVELTGKSLGNWVAKSANFLIDELDAEPEGTLALALDLHWRTLTWALAGWAAQLCVQLPAGAANADLAELDGLMAADALLAEQSHPVWARYETPAGLPPAAAIALPALADECDAALPGAVVDAAHFVRLQSDFFASQPLPDASLPALQLLGIHAEQLSHTQLLESAREFCARHGIEASSRVALDAGTHGNAEAVYCLLAGASVVLFSADLPQDRRADLCQQERVTVDLAQ